MKATTVKVEAFMDSLAFYWAGRRDRKNKQIQINLTIKTLEPLIALAFDNQLRKPVMRFELTTARLRIECSTTELHRQSAVLV